MAYTAASGVEIYALFFCETFYIAVFLEILPSALERKGEGMGRRGGPSRMCFGRRGRESLLLVYCREFSLLLFP